MNFAIFRVSEKKYKSIKEIKGFENHMERLRYTPNANTDIKNIRLIGSPNIVKDVEEYIKGIKLRSNAVLARELLLTTSPEFIQGASEELKQEWINTNLQWLKKEFGTNITYAIAHKDEKTLHISALLVPRFEDNKKGYILANRRYFNGAKALSEWQDKYSSAMEHLGLNRGIKWSKSKHTDIKLFYGIINADINEQDLQSLCSKAKNNILLESKIKGLQATLKAYRGYNQKTDKEKEEIKKQNVVLFKEVEAVRKDKELYKECIKTMSDLYKIPQSHIGKIFDYITSKGAEHQQGQERERAK